MVCGRGIDAQDLSGFDEIDWLEVEGKGNPSQHLFSPFIYI
jgi:hypothetical protein